VTSQHIFRALARVARTAGLVLGALFVASHASAGVTLAWDPVTDASGYYLYYGPMSGSYAGKINVGNVTTFTVSGLADGATYYFAASGYDAAGVEGRLSSEAIAYGVPVADFSASATSGAAPLAINLTNSSTGPIASYAWNFGDGTTSTVKNPSHVYSAPGVYSVALTVTGTGGSDTELKSFAAAAAEVHRINSAYLPKMAEAAPDQQRQLEQQALEETTAAVEKQGLTSDKYDEILSAAQTRNEVAKKVEEYLNKTPRPGTTQL